MMASEEEKCEEECARGDNRSRVKEKCSNDAVVELRDPPERREDRRA